MKRVLIIEDNENNMELMSFILQSNGYDTLQAFTGREGFQMTLSERPDFVLLDIQLPDIMGTAVLSLIREAEKEQNLPASFVIAVTSFAMSGDRERLLRAGCDGYIEKPIDPLVVMEQINKILGDNA